MNRDEEPLWIRILIVLLKVGAGVAIALLLLFGVCVFLFNR